MVTWFLTKNTKQKGIYRQKNDKKISFFHFYVPPLGSVEPTKLSLCILLINNVY